MNRVFISYSFILFFLSAGSLSTKQKTISDSYMVSTYAGSGRNGTVDGSNTKAAFGSMLNHIAADKQGNLYVNDGQNLRKITTDGFVTTLFGISVLDEDDNVKKIPQYLLSVGYGIVTDGENSIVLSMQDNTLVIIQNETTATILAGMQGTYGFADGTVASARFSDPKGMCMDKQGNIYVADSYNGRIRKISADKKTVTTIAGAGRGDFAPGNAKLVKFPQYLYAVAVDSKGNVYASVNGSRGSCVAKITPAGAVTSFAGNVNEVGDNKDGTGAAARIGTINAMCVDSKDNIWIACDNAVKKISPTGVVTTIAGLPKTKGSQNGDGKIARFSYLNGICADGNDDIYVTDMENLNIRKISLKK